MMRIFVERSLSASFRRLGLGEGKITRHRTGRRRRSRSVHDLNSWETLEGRVVLTASATWAWGGGSLLGTLSGIGVVTGPVVPNSGPFVPIAIPRHVPIWNGGMTTAGTGNNPISQLESDSKALTTELQSLAAKSGVTIADIENLALDGQSIAETGFHFKGSSLHTVISELATALASSPPGSTSQAQTDWTNLFSGSSVSTSVISGTFGDLSKAIQDSHVTTTDLSTVASDEAAIQNDLKNLWSPWMPASISGMGPSPLLATDSVAALSVALPSGPAVGVRAAQSIVGSLPVVSQPLIVSPRFPRFFPWGINLLGSLTHVGVVTGPVIIPQLMPVAMPMIPAGTSSNFQQLISDVKALQTELQSLAAKSGLTVAELESLATDSQSINQAGVSITPSALGKVISELAMAVAGSAPTSQAMSDWTALFSGSTVSTTVITNTFNDLVSAIQSSHVTTTDLTTVANDEAAIQTDLKNLFSAHTGSKGTGSGTGTGSSSGTVPGGSTGSKHSKPIPVVHKLVKGSGGGGKVLHDALHAKVTKAFRKKT
jgi:hypothetical protein